MIVGPILFNMFINYLDEGTEPPQQTFRLYKIADNTSAIQTHLDRLEKCADGNLTKFSNTMQSSAPGEESPPAPAHAAGESSLAQKDSLTDSKLNTSQQQASAAEAAKRSQAALGRAASRTREVVLPFCPALEESPLQCCVQCWASQYKADMDMLAISPAKDHGGH